MIFELRIYTVKPGTVNQVLEASGTVAREIRDGDSYGKLEGHWASEIGTLTTNTCISGATKTFLQCYA
jgi:hypothetical protein